MVICSKCGFSNPGGAEFCARDGWKLDPRDSVSAQDASRSRDGTGPAATDESPGEIERLRAELAARDARIEELERELDGVRRTRGTEDGDASSAADVPTQPPTPSADPQLKDKTSKSRGKKASPTDSSTVETTDKVPPPGQSYGWLVCVRGPLAGKRFEITAKGLPIGRAKKFGEQGGISIADNRISNPHAWIGVDPHKDTVFIRDEGSRNGTYLNDPASERIDEAPLTPGDTVFLAEENVGEFVYRK